MTMKRQYQHWNFLRYTPYVDQVVTPAVPVLGNVTWYGWLRRSLQGNQQEMFETLREKRNATEVLLRCTLHT